MQISILKRIKEKAGSIESLGERGLFGLSGVITALVLIALFTIALLLIGSLDDLVRWLAGQMNIHRLLIHVPPLSGYPGGPAEGATVGSGTLVASDVGGRLYSLFQVIGFALMVVAFVVIGMSFLFEQFNLLNPGTAEKLLSESVLVLILILIFPWFFNAAATGLNAVDKDVIMSVDSGELIEGGETVGGLEGPVPESDLGYREMVQQVADSAGTSVAGFGGIGIPDIPLGEIPDPSAIITVLVTATVSFMALFTAFAVGAFKLLATTALAAAFPLILALRLIPPTRNLANQLTSALIGVLMASLVCSLFFRVGWEILTLGGFGEHSGMRWVMGVGTLFAAAGALTITTRALYGVTRMLGGAVGRGGAASIGGMVTAGGAAVTAGAGGALGAGKMVGTAGKSFSGGQTAGIVGRGALGGLTGGAGSKSMAGAAGIGKQAGQKKALQKMAKYSPETGQTATSHSQAIQGYDAEANKLMDMKESGQVTSEQYDRLAQHGKKLVEANERGTLPDQDATDFHGHTNVAAGLREDYNETDRHAIQKQTPPTESKGVLTEAHTRGMQRKDMSEKDVYAALGSLHMGSVHGKGKESTIPERAEGLADTGEDIDSSRQAEVDEFGSGGSGQSREQHSFLGDLATWSREKKHR